METTQEPNRDQPKLIFVCRRILANHTAEKLLWTDGQGKKRRTLIDAASASLAVSCWEKFKPENKLKFATVCNRNPAQAINILWAIA